MKKFLCFTLSLFLLTGSLFSCQKTNGTENESTADTTKQVTTKSYSIGNVLEAGPYDHLSIANHRVEIQMSNHEYTETDKLNTTHTIPFNGNSVTGAYKHTSETPYYQEKTEGYIYQTDRSKAEYYINPTTKTCRSYSWVDKDYLQNNTKTEKTQEECLIIARDYFKQYVADIDAYSVSVEYKKIPEFQAVYKFYFSRHSESIKLHDSASISVTIFGDVYSHIFFGLGELRDIVEPNEKAINTAQEKVDEKLETIYGSLKDAYDIEYETLTLWLCKMADGRLALEYYIDVDLTSKTDPENDTKGDLTHLIVYLN